MGRRFFCFSAKSAGQISEGIAQQVEGIHLKKHKQGRFKMKKSLKRNFEKRTREGSGDDISIAFVYQEGETAQ